MIEPETLVTSENQVVNNTKIFRLLSFSRTRFLKFPSVGNVVRGSENCRVSRVQRTIHTKPESAFAVACVRKINYPIEFFR